MKRKTMAWLAGLLAVLLLALAGCSLLDDPIVYNNGRRLKNAVTALEDGETVLLNEVVPFEWDTLYTFDPYQSKAEIERIVGFQSDAIQENMVSEGMVHLLFVQGDRVAASVLSYRSNLGYDIDFSSKEEQKIAYTENASFQVVKTDEATVLLYAG